MPFYTQFEKTRPIKNTPSILVFIGRTPFAASLIKQRLQNKSTKAIKYMNQLPET